MKRMFFGASCDFPGLMDDGLSRCVQGTTQFSEHVLSQHLVIELGFTLDIE